jgi:hypothetical protein
MGRKPTGNPMGRPKKPIDWEQAEKLAYIQCTSREIGAFFGLYYETFIDRVKKDLGETYDAWYKKHSEHGKSSLRRSLWKMATAEKPNPSIAIWLSKQYLGMKDQPDEIFEQKPTIIKTRDGVEIKLGFNKDKGKSDDSD